MVKGHKIDRMFIAVILSLCVIGLVMVYSATMLAAKEHHHDAYHFLKRHLLWLLIGLILFTGIALFKAPFYLDHKVAMAAVFLSIIGLVLVFFSGKVNDSFRWIRFAGLSLQPSEFAKIAVVLYLASVLTRNDGEPQNLRRLLILLWPVFLIAILILKEPDIGTFLLILVLTGIVLLAAGLKLRYFMLAALCLIPLLFFIVKSNPEKMKRIEAFLEPQSQADSVNFQARQSIYAIGSGGIFGQGLGKSKQKLFFLPYANSDFIYAILGEEVGLLGTLVVTGLFFLLMFGGLTIARGSGSRQTCLLVVGLTSLVAMQALINISVTLGLFPTKGIALPFISSGGSSLISSLVVAGMIVNVSRRRKSEFFND